MTNNTTTFKTINMIQDIAAEEANRYLIDNSAMLHSKLHTSPATVITDAILHGVTFCLNTLAGSEGEQNSMGAMYGTLESEGVSKQRIDDIKNRIAIHTASAVAKAVGEKQKDINALLKEIAAYKLMLSDVEEITPKIPKDGNIPYITHEGSFEMFGEIFKVMVLNNGERVIEESDAIKLFNYLGITPTTH